MKKLVHLVLCPALFVTFGCSKSTDSPGSDAGSAGNSKTEEYKNFYAANGAELVSCLYYFNSDDLNKRMFHTERITERNGIIHYISKQYLTVAAQPTTYYGKADKLSIDTEKEPMSVKATNQVFSFSTAKAYNSYNEFDYDAQGNLMIIPYQPSFSFFPEYHGGVFAGYYNAQSGNVMGEKKREIGTATRGYLRKVGNELLFVDITRIKGYRDNDTAWDPINMPAIPFGPAAQPKTFDFETLGTNTGYFAWTSSGGWALTGDIYVMTYANSSFGAMAKISGAPVGHFAGIDGNFTIQLYRNPNEADNPYVVLRTNSKFHIYTFIKSTNSIQEVAVIPAPVSLSFNNSTRWGACHEIEDIDFAFTGNNIYMFALHSKLYKVVNSQFQEIIPDCIGKAADRPGIGDIEGGTKGLYMAINRNISNKFQTDIVLLKN
ncbi:hypothetical protein ACFSQD_03850 [Flavihumibacter stibioxidans]|uniref:DUF4374 domain-containing protein n=1 Tax=Flavihumibacter stibioxidans TaxID=1834163 RepID=A0ABR7M393_9BACT|nr:hypothetical protein [Flavihumibacter stibioxidans]MBC6489442.1 hypothetical protein [Flavihumibacter stibioxidans]